MSSTKSHDDGNRLVDTCILCKATTHLDDDETFWQITQGTPAWNNIPNPPEDEESVAACDNCYDKYLV